MNLFDLLAEAKIREWEERPRTQRSVAAEAGAHHQATESFERQLLQQITTLLEEAGKASPNLRAERLDEARMIEVQLMASLEKEGMNLAARRIADEINELRKAALSGPGSPEN